MKAYYHKVQYYETDRTGITHHTNYLRWMEEARSDFCSQIGFSFVKLEEMGVISPVLSLSCQYLRATTFEDEVFVSVSVSQYTGVKLHLSYVMTDTVGYAVCEAESEQTFLNREGRPIRLEREYPDLYAALMGNRHPA